MAPNSVIMTSLDISVNVTEGSLNNEFQVPCSQSDIQEVVSHPREQINLINVHYGSSFSVGTTMRAAQVCRCQWSFRIKVRCIRMSIRD